MKLVIAEKPSVGKQIAKVIGATQAKKGYVEGNGYRVSWCIGHLVELAEPEMYLLQTAEEKNKWNLKDLPIIPDKWKFAISSATKAQFFLLKELMESQEVSTIVCATDAGREGECIFRYVYNLVKCNKPVKRLWVSSMEDSAIKTGMENLKEDAEYDNLYQAGLARVKADWLIGMNLTRLYSVRYNTLLSIGRVQSPTLSMICDRYDKSTNFIKEKYYTVKLGLDRDFFVNGEEQYADKEDADNVREFCQGKTAVVTDYKEENKKAAPPLLYNLTVLQMEANRKYGYTAQKTLDITQKLYEAKLVTYPRTDSFYITEDMTGTVKRILDKINNLEQYKNLLQNEILNVGRLANNKKVSDHHALLPTENITNKNISEVNQDMKNILDLICKRLLISVLPACEYTTIKAILEVNHKRYTATDKVVKKKGFKALEERFKTSTKKEETGNDLSKIPRLKIGEKISITESGTVEHETAPPKIYTEETLLKAMEKVGLGTSATRAGVLETIVKRGFVIREGKNMVPTQTGVNLVKILPKPLKSAEITATWEKGLVGIEKGKVDYNDFLSKIKDFTTRLINDGKKEDTDTNLFIKEIGKCPKCQDKIVEYNKVVKCQNPECDFMWFKNFHNRMLSTQEIMSLLSTGKTKTISGFKNKDGESFSAKIKVNEEYKLELVFSKKKKTKRKPKKDS